MMAAIEVGERLWTVKQVQEYLQVSRSWVYREIEAQRFPHTRIGGVVRFIPEQVRQFAQERVHDGGARAKVIPIKPTAPKCPPTKKGG